MRGDSLADVVRRQRTACAATIAAVVALAAAAALLVGGPDPGARQGCILEIRSPDPAIRVRVEVRIAGRATPDVLEVGIEGARYDVARAVGTGSSGTVRAFATAPETVVWPRSRLLRDGATAVFHVEPLRTVRLDVPPDTRLPSGASLRFVPDRAVVPAGPPERVDALQAWIDTTSPTLLVRDGGTVARLPATAWWAFGEVGGRSVATHIDADAAHAALDPAPPRVLAREPTVGGRAIPVGTLVAPGRLDAAAVASVRSLLELGMFRGAHVRAPRPWTPVALPASAWVTLAHPSFGVAHVPWDGAPLADARPPASAVAFVRRGGGAFTGHVAVWPAWPGTDDVFSRPSDRFLRIAVACADRLVLRGLAPGTWRYDWSAAPGERRPATLLRRGQVRIDAAQRETVVELDMGE